jgi:hypothetical protein
MKPPSKNFLRGYLVFLIVFLSFVLLTGCQYRSYTEGQTKYTSLSIGTNQTVAPFSLKAGKEGDASFRELSSKGVTNDSTSIVESAVGAAVKAAVGK